jgi:hypothetical protein
MNYITSCFSWLSCLSSTHEFCKCLDIKKLFQPKEVTYKIQPVNDITYKVHMVDMNTYVLDPLNDIIIKAKSNILILI